MSENGFRFGDWQIDPDSNTLRSEGASATVEPKAMDVLRYLCRHAGAVIPPEELLQACWGNAELGDNPIHKAITQLRRALGDSASEPRYIETVRKRGYRAIAPVMAGEAALEGSWQQGSPFRGLESFQESHAAIFFGRMQATAQLRELVLKQASDGCAMALVLGPSGSGKTSLVRAGLLPGLMASRTGSGEPVALACTLYMDCADLADGNLFQTLAAVLMDAEVGGKLLFAGENAEGLGRWLESSDAGAIAGRLTEASGRIKIGLFIDRLEAIFRAPGVTDEIRARFIAVLKHLASSRAVLVMLACRNDFYPEVIALPALMALKSRGGHFDLNPPDGAEIAQMVRMPAKAAGLKFEVDPSTGASLDDVLCDAARGSPDTLPLLQYCLDELYRQRGDDGALRFDVLKQLGGMEGAIAVRAEQIISNFQQEKLDVLPHIFSLITDIGSDQAIVIAKRAEWSDLPNDEAKAAVTAFVEARLFVSELSGGQPSFGVAHEALLRRWPRIVAWIEQHRHTLQILARLRYETSRWVAAGRPRDLLIPNGSRINQAKELSEAKGISLSIDERTYVSASLSASKRTETIRRAVMGLISILAVVALLLGITAKRAQAEAEIHRTEAEGLTHYMLGQFAEKLRPLGKLELLDDVSAKALAYLSQSSLANASPDTSIQRAKALQVIAEVNIAKARPEKTMLALQTARKILQEQSKHESSKLEITKELGSNSFWLGQVSLDRNDWPQANRHFLDYLNKTDQLLQSNPNNFEFILEKSYAYSSLGSLALRSGDLARAVSQFHASLDLKNQALRQRPSDINLITSISNSTSGLAETNVKMGQLRDALNLHRHANTLIMPIYERNPEDGLWAVRLARSLSFQGELEYELGLKSDAIKHLKLSDSIFHALVSKDENNKVWQFNYGTNKLRILRMEPDSEKKLAEQLALYDNFMVLRAQDPKNIRLAWLVIKFQHSIAETYMNLGNSEAAFGILRTSTNDRNALPKSTHDDLISTDLYAKEEIIRSRIERLQKKPTLATKSCQKAVNSMRDIAEKSNDFRTINIYKEALQCAGMQESAQTQENKLRKMKEDTLQQPEVHQ
jgi:DNA-binding winged helix-turn-helix (wHTH) protein/tetratricopeptide (TPR) repeat protein